MPLDTANGESQGLRHFSGRPSLEGAQDEDLSLTSGKLPKGLPDPPARLPADNLFFWGQALTAEIRGQEDVVRRGPFRDGFAPRNTIGRTPPFPPPGAASVATGVHGDPGEPRSPGHRVVLSLIGSEQLEEDLLRYVLSFIGIRQQQATQPSHPRVMRAVELFIVCLLSRARVHVSYPLHPLSKLTNQLASWLTPESTEGA